MQNQSFVNPMGRLPGKNFAFNLSRKTVIGIILIVALVAFEIFNFDTTRFALDDLLGGISFVSLPWSAILAVAFCAIDFAGLARLFTPERGSDEPKAIWYLMGAWLLGATMNAIMTWWAVSLALIKHELGNEILTREQLIQMAPIFVAALVWLTRILFIGAFSVAGEHIFDLAGRTEGEAVAVNRAAVQPTARPTAVQPTQVMPVTRAAQPAPKPQTTAVPQPQVNPVLPQRTPAQEQRVRQRPPVPGGFVGSPVPMQARSRNNN